MMHTKITTLAELRDAYTQLKDRVGNAAVRSGRSAEHVCVVAVTKTAAPDQIRQLVELGHIDLGENRVQQLSQRAASLNEFLARRRTLGAASPRGDNVWPEAVRWHMIGRLQRNKVKQVAPLVSLIHSVHNLRLAEELHAYGAKTDTVIDVLLQVNSSGEDSKQGISPPAVIHLAEQIDTMLHLRLRGLMTMAPYTEDPEESRGVFRRTAELFTELRRYPHGGEHCDTLSMGMSNDYEVAVEEGSNMVRVGRALFGEGDPNADTGDDSDES